MRRGSVISSRFRINRFVQGGGMGAVYEALDLERNLPVAIKIAKWTDDDELSTRFAREARILSRLAHPGIVEYVTDGVTDSGQRFLAMEWLDGRDLRDRIRESPLTEEQTISIGLQICSALGAVHRSGVRHRDLKPANIFLVEGDIERVKLLDFGLAHMDAMPLDLTQSGALVGTPSFVAPEMARGEAEVDSRSDIYSLGAVLYCCLTQKPPFVGTRVMAVLAKLLFEEAPRVVETRSDISPAINRLIARLLAKSRDERPVSTDEVAAQLNDIRATHGMGGVFSDPAIAISGVEQHYISVLLIEHATLHKNALKLEELEAWAQQCHGRLQRLVDGTIIVVFSATSDPIEMAGRAARCALRLQSLYPHAGMVLATGRGLLNQRVPVGEVIDRAAELMFGRDDTLVAGAEPSPMHSQIVVDNVASGLLQSRFQLRPDPLKGQVLMAENSYGHHARDLLGERTECVGRERELSTLAAIYDECTDEPDPRVVLLVGAAGVGKSRVVHEFVHRLRSRAEKFSVWSAHGDSMRSGAAFGVLAQLLCQAMDIAPGDAGERRRTRLENRINRLFPPGEARRITVFLGELIGERFSDAGDIQLQEARRDPRLMHDQMRQAWEDWIDAETAQRPVILVLSDLHWCDRPTVQFVDAALRNLDGRPFMVLGISRPDIHTHHPDLWSARGVEQIALRPLPRRECIKLARKALPSHISDGIVARIVDRANGNPFYLEELIRSVARGHGDEIPDTVLAIVGSRIGSLPAEGRKVLRAASIFGRKFWVGGVAELLGEPGSSLVPVLDELEKQELIRAERRSRFAGETEYGFRHNLTREAAYSTLTPDDRRRAHLEVGHWLEQIGETDPALLAEHYRRAQEPTRAMPFFVAAAEQALEGEDMTAVMEYAERALRSGAVGEVKGRVRLLQAEACNWESDHESACRYGREAMSLLPAASDAWAHCAHHLGWAAGAQARFDEVDSIADQLMADLDGPARILRLIALVWCASHLAVGGNKAKATAIGEVVREIESKIGIVPSLAGARSYLEGHLALMAGKPDRTAQCNRESRKHWQAAGNQRNACLSGLNEAEALIMLGQYAAAEETVRASLLTAQRLGAGFLIDGSRNFLGVCLGRLARFGEAQQVLGDSLARDEDTYVLYLARASLAEVLVGAGKAPAALEESDRVMPLIAGFPHLRARVLAIRSRALHQLRRHEDALAAAREGMLVVDEVGFIEDGDALLRLAHAEALHLTGHPDEARSAILEAREILRNRAEQIEDSRWRQSFLHRVEENRRTLELADEWLDCSGRDAGPARVVV